MYGAKVLQGGCSHDQQCNGALVYRYSRRRSSTQQRRCHPGTECTPHVTHTRSDCTRTTFSTCSRHDAPPGTQRVEGRCGAVGLRAAHSGALLHAADAAGRLRGLHRARVHHVTEVAAIHGAVGVPQATHLRGVTHEQKSESKRMQLSTVRNPVTSWPSRVVAYSPICPSWHTCALRFSQSVYAART